MYKVDEITHISLTFIDSITLFPLLAPNKIQMIWSINKKKIWSPLYVKENQWKAIKIVSTIGCS